MKWIILLALLPIAAIAEDDSPDYYAQERAKTEAYEAQANADNETARYLEQRRIADINDSVRERNREVWFPNEARGQKSRDTVVLDTLRR
jgi:hypothetical protein